MLIDALHFDTSFSDLDVDSRSHLCKKTRPSVPFISQRFKSIWVEFGTLSNLVHILNLILIIRSVFKGEKPIYMVLSEDGNIGLHLNINRPTSFKHGLKIETTELYKLIPVGKIKHLGNHFLAISPLI